MAHYSRVPDEESVSFDYSSAFTYESTAAAATSEKYASTFTYGRKAAVDITLHRGLKNKDLSAQALHWLFISLYFVLIVVTLPITIWFVVKRVKDSQQAIVSRLGIVKCVKGPTVMLTMPFVDTVKWYDTSLRAFNVPPQKMMTQDGLVLEVGAVVTYRITDAEKVFFAAQNIDHALRSTAQTVTSKFLTKTEEKWLSDSTGVSRINSDIKFELQRMYMQWGVALSSYEMTGLKALVRIEQQDAIHDVIEPIKQWLTSGHADDTPSSQMFSMLSSAFTPQTQRAVTAASAAASDADPVPNSVIGNPASNIAAVRHNLTPNDLLTAVKSICNRQLCEQVDTVYKFIVPDTIPSVYYMDLKHGDGDCGPGEPPAGNADTIITISLANMQLMFTGELKPFNAYMSGDLRIDGDTSGAMKLDELVRTIAALTADAQ